MASTFTDWRGISSKGFIAPSILPARVFQFRLSSYIWAYISDEGAGAAAALVGSLGGVGISVTGIGSKTIVQDFVFQIVRGADSEGEGGEVVFEARVEVQIFLLALVQDQGFGTALAIYTWNMVDGQSVAQVRIPEPPPSTLGTAQIDTNPASGSGTTNAVIEIIFDIVTPAWEFDLEEGDVCRVPFAAAGPPYVVKTAAVALRTILGGRLLHTLRDPRIGQSWNLWSDAGGTKVITTARRGGVLTTTQDDPAVTTERTRYGRLLRTGATIKALVSGDRTYLAAPYSDAINGTQWQTIMDIDTGINILGSVSSPDGAIIYAYGTAARALEGIASGAAARLVLKRGKDDVWAMGERDAANITGNNPPPLPLRDVAGLELIDGTLRLTAKDDELFRVFLSGDEGATWRAV